MAEVRRNDNKYKTLGIAVPIVESAIDGIFDPTTSTREKVKSQLHTLLFTGYEERVNLPEFGSPLRDMIFENIDDSVKAELKTELIGQISKYVPEAEVIDMIIFQENNTLTLELIYSLKADRTISDSIVVVIK